MESNKYSFRGVEYEFQENRQLIERYICPICQELINDPVQTSCGHLFCEFCLRINNSGFCPACRTLFSEQPRRDKFNQREVKKLTVSCPNKAKGCSLVGDLGDIIKHCNLEDGKGCLYQLVTCSKCRIKMEGRHYSYHIKEECPSRLYTCPNCHNSGPYEKIANSHLKECSHLPIECPNKCGVTNVLRKDISDHLCSCPLEVVSCRYKVLGCRVSLPRKMMKHHLSEKKDDHLDIALDTITQLTTRLSQLQSSLDFLSYQFTFLTNAVKPGLELPKRPVPQHHGYWLQVEPFPLYPPCVLRITRLAVGTTRTHPFYSKVGGYQLNIRVSLENQSFLTIELDFNHLDDTNNFLPNSCVEVDLTLLNQTKDSSHISHKLNGNAWISEVKDSRVRFPLPSASRGSTCYIKDGQLFVRINSVK